MNILRVDDMNKIFYHCICYFVFIFYILDIAIQYICICIYNEKIVLYIATWLGLDV